MALDRLIMELAEEEEIKDPVSLRVILAEYQRMGVKIALDDFGSGYAGLKLLAILQPDLIKLEDLQAATGALTGRDAYVERLKRLPLERPPGERVVYSDPGYILLGFALARAGGATLDRLFAERVARPLALRDLLYRPPRSLRRRIAATEAGNRREKLLAGAEGDGYNGWRTEVAWGEVHDLNARALGGVSAHAGLFGTARAKLRGELMKRAHERVFQGILN